MSCMHINSYQLVFSLVKNTNDTNMKTTNGFKSLIIAMSLKFLSKIMILDFPKNNIYVFVIFVKFYIILGF
jgi:hypothetical protein